MDINGFCCEFSSDLDEFYRDCPQADLSAVNDEFQRFKSFIDDGQRLTTDVLITALHNLLIRVNGLTNRVYIPCQEKLGSHPSKSMNTAGSSFYFQFSCATKKMI